MIKMIFAALLPLPPFCFSTVSVLFEWEQNSATTRSRPSLTGMTRICGPAGSYSLRPGRGSKLKSGVVVKINFVQVFSRIPGTSSSPIEWPIKVQTYYFSWSLSCCSPALYETGTNSAAFVNQIWNFCKIY